MPAGPVLGGVDVGRQAFIEGCAPLGGQRSTFGVVCLPACSRAVAGGSKAPGFCWGLTPPKDLGWAQLASPLAPLLNHLHQRVQMLRPGVAFEGMAWGR